LKCEIYGLTVHLDGLPHNAKGITVPTQHEEAVFGPPPPKFRLQLCNNKAITPSDDLIEARLQNEDGSSSLNDFLEMNVPWPQAPTAHKVKKTIPVPSTSTNVSHVWSKCKYSPNLAHNTSVYVSYKYSPVLFHICANDDDDALTKFQQDKLSNFNEKSKPLTAPPVPDQIVVGCYSEQYFRGRVEKVEGDNCTVLFVDYGDRNVCRFSELFPVDDSIMEFPVYGMMVRLENIPEPPTDFELTAELNQILDDYLTLDLPKNVSVAPMPQEGSYIIPARLWLASNQEYLVNETIKKAFC